MTKQETYADDINKQQKPKHIEIDERTRITLAWTWNLSPLEVSTMSWVSVGAYRYNPAATT